jgi:hypothetical protein
LKRVGTQARVHFKTLEHEWWCAAGQAKRRSRRDMTGYEPSTPCVTMGEGKAALRSPVLTATICGGINSKKANPRRAALEEAGPAVIDPC